MTGYDAQTGRNSLDHLYELQEQLRLSRCYIISSLFKGKEQDRKQGKEGKNRPF